MKIFSSNEFEVNIDGKYYKGAVWRLKVKCSSDIILPDTFKIKSEKTGVVAEFMITSLDDGGDKWTSINRIPSAKDKETQFMFYIQEQKNED